MSCRDEYGDCHQGKRCPAQQHHTQPPTDAPQHFKEPSIWCKRLHSIASAAGYAALTILAMGVALLIASGFTYKLPIH